MRTIEVQYGYENRAKGGRNMPVRLGIDNRADAAMEGSVEFLFRQPDGELYAYAYPLRLTAGGNLQCLLCGAAQRGRGCFLGAASGQRRETFGDEAGGTHTERRRT